MSNCASVPRISRSRNRAAEVDIRCSWEGGQLKVGEGDDWLEILGSPAWCTPR